MALIQCPECGKTVSSLATSCPECGYPLQQGNAQSSSAPAQPREVPVTIQRESHYMGWPIAGNVYIDQRLIGTIKNGGTLSTTVSEGRHSVMVETDIRHGDLFVPLSTSTAHEGMEMNVTSTTRSVTVLIGFKISYLPGSTGKLTVQSVRCREL